MIANAAPFQSDNALVFTEFELVRNNLGAWLLVVPDLPEAITDNPFIDLRAGLDGINLVLQASNLRITFQSLITESYFKALSADHPQELMLCVVDDDGVRRFSKIIPCII